MRVLNLRATFASRAANKKAYENIQDICDKANEDLEKFVEQRLNQFLEEKLGLSDESDLREYRQKVVKISGEETQEFFFPILNESVFLFRIRKISEQVDGKVIVSYIYEV